MRLTATIVEIELHPPEGWSDDHASPGPVPPVQVIRLSLDRAFQFHPGQYLKIVHPNGTLIPLSIASPPEALPILELHYRSTPGLPEAELVDELLRTSATLEIDGPNGDVKIQPDDDRSLMLVAGGTGIAQALCLIRAQLARHPTAEVSLLACADREEDFYFRDMLPDSTRLAVTLVADPDRSERNRALAWIRSNPDPFLAPHTAVILSGGPAFVYAVTDALTEIGCDPRKLASDVYAYAPRDG